MKNAKYIFFITAIIVLASGSFFLIKTGEAGGEIRTPILEAKTANSSIVMARVEFLSAGSTTSTIFLGISTVARGVLDSVTIEIPIVGSSDEINRDIKKALKNIGSLHLQKDDKILLLGGVVQ